jgi:hypothetical protein
MKPVGDLPAKLRSGLSAFVFWLVLAVPVYGGFYACSAWLADKLADKPFATAAECNRALAYVQRQRLRFPGDYDPDKEAESCVKAAGGGWCGVNFWIDDPRRMRAADGHSCFLHL